MGSSTPTATHTARSSPPDAGLQAAAQRGWRWDVQGSDSRLFEIAAGAQKPLMPAAMRRSALVWLTPVRVLSPDQATHGTRMRQLFFSLIVSLSCLSSAAG